MLRSIVIVFLMILGFQEVKAQSLLHSKPLDFNPGFAGSKTYDRISFNVNELSSQSRNLYFSYDRLVKPLKGGIGCYAQRELLKNGIQPNWENKNEKTTTGLVYSPKIIVKRRFLLSPAIDIAGILHKTERTQQVDEVTSLLLYRESSIYLRSKTGFLLNSENFYTGYHFINIVGNQQWYNSHDFQAGYIHGISLRNNLLIDARWIIGEQHPEYMRTYKKQLNMALQHRNVFLGAGINDLTTVSVMGGLKLINLKISAAYHVLSPSNVTNTEIAVQYVFDKDNDEKLMLPFRKWWIKLKM